MKRLAPPLRLSAIFLFVFGTGFTGLVYEITWQKYLARLLGSDTSATAVVIGVFLGGLSLGYLLLGRHSVRARNPMKLYALLEAIIGVWCALFPLIFDRCQAWTADWSFAPPLWMLIEGTGSAALLMLVPTVCMGATIPLLTRSLSLDVTAATRVHARLYAVNTAGACAGALITGFVLIPVLGLPITVMSASAVNLTAALFFAILASAPGTAESVDAPAPVEAPPPAPLPVFPIYTVGFLGGFSVMTLENVLFRIGALSLGSSSYSFALVLSVFLFTIAVGSAIVARLRRIDPSTLFWNQLLFAVALGVLYFTLDLWPVAAHRIRILTGTGTIDFALHHALIFVALTTVLAAPLLLSGAALPIAFHLLKRNLATVGRQSGVLLSVNTLGCLLGSLLGGIAIYHVADCPRVYLTAVVLAAVTALIAAGLLSRRHRYLAIAGLVVGLMLLVLQPGFARDRFAIGLFRLQRPVSFSHELPAAVHAHLLKDREILYHRDGPEGSVAVVGARGNPLERGIFVNGKSDSDIRHDRRTLTLLAHLPALFAKKRQRVAIIGLGTGVTAGEMTLYGDVRSIDVAEISLEVEEALPFFASGNRRVADDPRLHIHRGDAFRVIGRGTGQWDIIISEPSNPWVTGVDMLYTREFYALAQQHMSGDGVFLQWAHIYTSSPEAVGMIANTLVRSFADVNVFYGESGDLLFMATSRTIDADRLAAAQRLFDSNDALRRSLAGVGIASMDALLRRQVWNRDAMRALFSGAGIQTMDRPRLHYIAGMDAFRGEGLPLSVLYQAVPEQLFARYLYFVAHPEAEVDRRLFFHAPAAVGTPVREIRRDRP